MNIIFIEPSFPYNQREFVRGLAAAGANVIGIGERPPEYLNDDVKGWLSHYVQVPSVVHEPSLLKAVRSIQKSVWVDRLEATVEAHIMAAAAVREACGIPGTSTETAYLCRDKPAMKEALRKAGIPCAQSTRATTPDEARQFAATVGYPLIIKPPAGAGASATFRVDNDAEMENVIKQSGLQQGVAVAIEEFIEGHEGFLDTLAVNGEVGHEFITHYYPNVLEAMRERWISPQMVVTNRMDAPGYDEVKIMARKVIKALNIGTSATHMEWFYGPKGLKFSEIGCRPPGVGQWDVYNAGNDFDIYFEWAHTLVHGCTHSQPSRRYAAGMIALRPEGDGRISGYSGVNQIGRKYGNCIVAAHLPQEGTPTQPIEGGYMANAWMRVRHPDYDTLRSIMDEIGTTIRVHAN
ncbi:MAG: ATP-grasp domain-containing protein [Gammaproteobacteria bacterium]|nr:ATP-grasp domain-containing protein [Gammaproteobacteria bacterium]NNF66696.1 ATP-grasp domain-containing protein [Gammaproteobacteria bacterium]